MSIVLRSLLTKVRAGNSRKLTATAGNPLPGVRLTRCDEHDPSDKTRRLNMPAGYADQPTFGTLRGQTAP
jgi:hypothetical protein